MRGARRQAAAGTAPQGRLTATEPPHAAGGLDAPGFLVVSAGARYLTHIGCRDVTLRALIGNVLNRRYRENQYADSPLSRKPVRRLREAGQSAR